MPRRALRPCAYPGCAALVADGSRCPAHPYPRKKDTRPSAARRGYDAEWSKVRLRYLRDHPFCEYQTRCDGAPATEVDHVTPLADGGTHHPDNLKAACKACHSRKTMTTDAHLRKR